MPRSEATRRRTRMIQKMAKGEPITRRDLDLQKALDEIAPSSRVFKKPGRSRVKRTPSPTSTS